MDAIQSALGKKDTEVLQDACHALKGACYSIRAMRLAKVAAEIENKASEIPAAEKLYPFLEETSAQTIAWWQEILEKNLLED